MTVHICLCDAIHFPIIGLLPLGVAVLATILDIVAAEAVIAIVAIVIAVVAMLNDETTLNESKII